MAKPTPAIIEAARDARALGLSHTDAARLAGVSASTWYRWRKRGRAGDAGYVDFANAVEGGAQPKREVPPQPEPKQATPSAAPASTGSPDPFDGRDPASLEPLDFWTALVNHYSRMLATAGATSGAANIAKRLEEARARLDLLRDEAAMEAERLAPMTDEEADRAIEMAAHEMPMPRLRLAVDVFFERERLPPISELMSTWRKVHKPKLELVGDGA